MRRVAMVKDTMFSMSEAATDIISRLSEPLPSEAFDETWRRRWRALERDVADLSTLTQAGMMIMEFESNA